MDQISHPSEVNVETDVDKSSIDQCFSQDTDNYSYLQKCAGIVEFGQTQSDKNKLLLTDKFLDKSSHSIRKFLEQQSEEDIRISDNSPYHDIYMSSISQISNQQRADSPEVKQFILPRNALMITNNRADD